jgi:DNA adenine methylase
VNRDGVFNVPIGNRQNVVFPTDNFPEIARLLHRAALGVADFEKSIGEAQEGDLIFVDPPYTVRHNNNGFIKYNDILFRWQDQERLVDVLSKARDRGAKIVGTNANHDSLRDIYKKAGFSIKVVSRFSPISASTSNRRQFEEMLILSE